MNRGLYLEDYKHDKVANAKYNRELFTQLEKATDATERERITEEIVLANLRAVGHAVKKFNNMKDHKDDLYSAGYLGLYKAIKTFKPDKGIQFMTYATRIIENEMLMIFRKYKKMKTDMSIHESMGSDAEGHDLTLEQILPDLRSEEELETIMRSELASKILEHLEFRLSVTSRNGSKAFTIYSIYLEGESTHREIGDLFGLSQSYISRIITKCDKMVKEIAYKLMEGKSL